MEKRNLRKERIGVVSSDKMEKSIVVSEVIRVKHPMYGKFLLKTKKYIVHDEKNDSKIGDTVKIMETRPISKRKLDRIGNSILDKQQKFRKERLQPTSRKLIRKWEEMRTNEWKMLPEEQRLKEKIAYEHEREQLIEYGVILQNTTKHYEILQDEYNLHLENEKKRPRLFRCCLSSKE